MASLLRVHSCCKSAIRFLQVARARSESLFACMSRLSEVRISLGDSILGVSPQSKVLGRVGVLGAPSGSSGKLDRRVGGEGGGERRLRWGRCWALGLGDESTQSLAYIKTTALIYAHCRVNLEAFSKASKISWFRPSSTRSARFNDSMRFSASLPST